MARVQPLRVGYTIGTTLYSSGHSDMGAAAVTMAETLAARVKNAGG